MTFDQIQDTIQSLDSDVTVIRFDYADPPSYADEVRKSGSKVKNFGDKNIHTGCGSEMKRVFKDV